MAVAHLSVKVGKVGKGAVHAEYISREGKYKQRLSQGEKLEAVESGNMPKWAEADPMYFWQMADAFERKNGSVYREHEIALPRELNKEQRIELVRNWVKKELGENHAYTWAIHNKIGLDGGEQPHLHLMFSDRLNDGIERSPEQYFKRYNPRNPEKGGCRKANYQSSYAERKEALKKLRQRWEDLHNQTMKNYSIYSADISMLSYEERGIAKVAQAKLSPMQSNALHQYKMINRALDYLVDESPLDTLPKSAVNRLRISYNLVGGFSKLNSSRYYRKAYMDNLTELDVLAYRKLSKFLSDSDGSWVVKYFDAREEEREQKRVMSMVQIPERFKTETPEAKVQRGLAVNKAFGTDELAEIKAEYEKRLEVVKVQEKRLEQVREEVKRVERDLAEVAEKIKRSALAYDERGKMMEDAEKRLEALQSQWLGGLRHSSEIAKLKDYLAESGRIQMEGEAFALELVKTHQSLSEALKDLRAWEGKAKSDLDPLRKPLGELGALYRLARVEPEQRKAWQESERKRELRCVGLLPSSREFALEDELKRFGRGGEQKQQCGRGFSR